MKIATSGGVPTALASGQPNPAGLAVDAKSVYWTTNVAGGSVLRAQLAGGSPSTLISGQTKPLYIAVDDTSVYWTNYGDDTVMKLTPK